MYPREADRGIKILVNCYCRNPRQYPFSISLKRRSRKKVIHRRSRSLLERLSLKPHASKLARHHERREILRSDEALVRIVEHVANELVVHGNAVLEIVGIENGVGKLAPKLALEHRDGLLDGVATQVVPHDEDVEPVARVLHENAGCDEKVDAARGAESLDQVGMLEEIPLHQELAELVDIGELLRQEPAVGALLLRFARALVFHLFGEGLSVHEIHRRELRDHPSRDGSVDARTVGDVGRLKSARRIEQEQPHDLHARNAPKELSQNVQTLFHKSQRSISLPHLL